jgi:hypothetical protein
MRLPLIKYSLTVTVLIIIAVPLTLFPSCVLLLAPLTSSIVSLCAFYFADSSGNRSGTRVFAASGVQLAQTNHDMFRFHREAFYSQLKSKVGNMLAKAVY